MTLIDWLLVAGVVGVFGYWRIRERQEGVDQNRGGHSKMAAILIRWLMPVAGLGIILQALGWGRFSLPISEMWQVVLQYMGLVIFGAGVGLGVWAREVLGSNWAHAADFQIREGQVLVQAGPYRWIRHPIYTAFGLMLVGAELVFASWLVFLAFPLFLYLDWQARAEEQLLSRHFGSVYEEYAARTGRLWPRLW